MKNVNYEKYFSPGQSAKVVIRLDSGNFIDKNAEIVSIAGNLAQLELLGEGIGEKGQGNKTGGKVTLFASSGWGLFHCTGVLEESRDDRNIFVRLTGKVEEQQRREYFRLDVETPLVFDVPKEQHITSVTSRWIEKKNRHEASAAPVMVPIGGGYKVVKWKGGDDLTPVGVNLSGGGLRIKTSEFIEAGTRALVDIFLPLAPSRVICAVAEVIRSNEIQLSWEKGTSYTTAMKFVNIDEKDREAIIFFVFSEQRNQLKAVKEKKS